MDSISPAALLTLDSDALMEAVARQTFKFFWDGAEPSSFMARDRTTRSADPVGDLVAVGGTGFGVMALVVAVERGWIGRDVGLERLNWMVEVLERAERHHGAYPHFLHGETGRTIPFMPNDDGGDLVETALLMMGLITARQYFAAEAPALAARITALFDDVEWDWYRRGENVLYWHWSPHHGWAMNHSVRGWNETLIVYVLAAGASHHGIDRRIYEEGFCRSADYHNDKTYRGVTLPLGPDGGGPLFFAHYSFCGLDPHGLRDSHADYWKQNVAQVAVNRDHCIANPGGFKGYGPDCWGLTASDDPSGYDAHAPNNDNGTISPTAALASIPYAPEAGIAAMRHFLSVHGEKVWGRFGFVDAFNETKEWWADTYLAIDQGPIIVMMENYRTGLLWKLFMAAPEVQKGLGRLGFKSAEA
ncbi:MAG TPA: glucoamylase family protein [Rhizomicrobium sp.]|jgi:hypothetical protein